MTAPTSVDRALAEAERAVARGGSLEGTGFWRAVSYLRRHPEEAARYADRVGAVDRRAFELRVRLRVPAWLGTILLAGGTLAGVAGLVVAGRVRGLGRAAVFLVAFGVLDLATHSLAHWAVGRILGIRFTHYFLGGPPPPRPGAKVDYASYLRTPARRRALMHASGAMVTKAVPFVMIPAAAALDLPGWVVALLVVVGAGQIATDVAFSTKSSDWKKVRRELRAAREGGSGG